MRKYNGQSLELVHKKHLPPVRLNFSGLFQTSEADSIKYFQTPSLSSEAQDLLRRENPQRSKQFFDAKTKALDRSISDLDSHLHHRAKVASFSLLLPDALTRSHENSSLLDASILLEIFNFLDDCFGFCLHEFALGFAVTSFLRRSLVLNNLFLPSVGTKDRLLGLPLGGSDLFDNRFGEVMLQEAKLLKTEDKLDFHRCSAKRQFTAATGPPSKKKPCQFPSHHQRDDFTQCPSSSSMPRKRSNKFAQP